MKYFVLVAAAAMALASCVTPEMEDVTVKEDVMYTFLVGNAGEDSEAGSKAVIGRDCVEWENADRLGTYTTTVDVEKSPSVNRYSTVTVEEDNPVTVAIYASGGLAVGDMIYCYYPYSDSNDEVEMTSVGMCIPVSQAEKNAMPMVSIPFEVESASVESQTSYAGEIRVVNLGSIIEFNVYSTTEEYKSEVVKSIAFNADEAIAGNFNYDLTAVDYSDEETLGISGYEETAVTYTPSEPVQVGVSKEEAAKMNMVVAPGTHSGKIVVTTDKALYTYPLTAREFVRSNMKPLGLNLRENVREGILYHTDFSFAIVGNSYQSADEIVGTDNGALTSWGIVYGNWNGSECAQMRVYKDQETFGSVYMKFDVSKVTKVTYKAKVSDANLKLNTYYSTDSGETWIPIDEEKALTEDLTEYEMLISGTGEYDKVRIKFEADGTAPAESGNYQLTIDDVVVYGKGDVLVDKTPMIVPEVAAIDVPAAGGAQSITCEIINAVDGVALSAVSSVDWITGLECVGNIVNFEVGENGSESDREGIITISYTGAESMTVTVNQEAELPDGLVVDVLTRSTTEVTGTSYKDWSGKTVTTSSAVYAGNSAGGNESIQLRSENNNSGVVTIASGGYVKRVDVVWNSNTTTGRTIDIYGRNSAYTSATDLYDKNRSGVLLGSVVYGTSTYLELTEDYQYIGFRSHSGAQYLSEVKITWSSEATGNTPSPYIALVSVPEDNLSAEGENVAVQFVVENPVDDKTLSATSDADWLENITVTEGVVTMDVAVNSSTSSRTADLKLSYEGAADVTVQITQKGQTVVIQDAVVDVLTRATTEITGGSYKDWSGKTVTSSAVYAGNSAGGKESIQLRSSSSNSGIVTTASGGLARKITVTWNSNTDAGRTLDVYGKSTAYTAAAELYAADTRGTKLGSIVYGTSDELVIEGDYQYIGLRSNSNAMYLTDISITWSIDGSGTPALTERNLSFASTSVEAILGADFTEPTLNGSATGVTYSSSNTSVATVSATTGEVTLVGAGSTTITASAPADETYAAGEASYTLTVADLGEGVVFYESFDKSTGTMGWYGNVANGTLTADNVGWTFVSGTGAAGAAKFGTGSAKGSATTPPLGQSGNMVLTFKAGAWSSNSEQTTLMLYINNGGALDQGSVTMVKGEWTDYTVYISEATAATTITFAGKNTSNSRFFLDDVKIAASSDLSRIKGWLELPGAAGSQEYVHTLYKSEDEAASADLTARNYTYNYDVDMLTSLWVAYPLYAEAYSGGLASPENWSYNPELDQNYQINVRSHSYGVNVGSTDNTDYDEDEDYYARGHQLPNADRSSSASKIDQAYYVTNQTPQINTGFNSGIWKSLEEFTRSQIPAADTVYVVTGAAFQKIGESEKAVTWITPQDDSKTCPVPNYYWKVLLKVQRSGSTVTSASTVGFWYEHKSYAGTEANFNDDEFVVSVDQIEEWTGFDFFVNLPDTIESATETAADWSAFSDF